MRLPAPLRTLSWANYLGMSWTWCVGMFLPVAAYHDFGFGGWVAVAIPNVLGAASVGFTFARPGTSEATVVRHRTAFVAFSAITLAFHAFFLFWLAHADLIPLWAAAAAVVVGLTVGLVNRRAAAVDLLLGWAVLAVSLVVLGYGLAHVGRATVVPPHPPRTATAMTAFAAVCAVGFLTCPYLDLTFHRACQTLPPQPKRIAFAVGLGVLFLAMLAGTLLYAGDFNLEATGAFTAAGLSTWIATHLCAQCGYKFAVHLRALPAWRPTDAIVWLLALATAGLFAAGLLTGTTLGFHAPDALIVPGQVYYRLFMAFYGLAFPAYIWLCMTPLPGRPAPGPTRPALIVLAVTLAIVAPTYWLAFLRNQWTWILPGIAILLAARLVIPQESELATVGHRRAQTKAVELASTSSI